MTMTREAKAAEILKAHRAAARVAKARQLSPAFDAECRAAERPVGFWQRAGFTFGWLRGRWVGLLVLAGMVWMFVKIAPFLWLIVKGLAFLIPLWIIVAVTRPCVRPYRGSYWYYSRRTGW